MNVLIVDACDCNRTITRGLVRSMRAADIAEASNPADASAILGRFTPDLVIMSAELVATEDGAAFIRVARDSAEHAGVVVLRHDPTDHAPGTEGAVVLDKPFSRRALAEAIGAATERKRAA